MNTRQQVVQRGIPAMCTHSWFFRFCLSIFLGFVLAKAGISQNYHRSDDVFAQAHTYPSHDGERVLKTYYHYVVSRHGMNYIVRTFFPETGALTGYFTYSDRNLRVLNGPFRQLSDDGRAETTGAYRNGELHGLWETKADSVVLLAGTYDQGLRIGVWREHYPSGQLKSEFSYDGGEELGPYVLYDTAGVVLDRGNSILGERYTSLPPAEFAARRGSHVVDEFPCFGECPDSVSRTERAELSGKAVSAYIQQNLITPAVVRQYGIGGRVNASVLIDESGKVVEIDIVNGLCEPIAAECRRLLATMPAWRPGTKGGKPAPVKVLVPFAFAMD